VAGIKWRHWAVAVRIDQPDGDDGHARAPDVSDTPVSRTSPGTRDTPEVAVTPEKRETREVQQAPDAEAERQARLARVKENRAIVDATYRAYAIDQAYEKIREIERGTITPAMKRIEAEDPNRHLAGLEHRLKGKDRLTEKVNEAVEERGHSVESALGLVKDAIRYTFVYSEDRYTQGVHADCERLEADNFERVDLKNLWDGLEYKGINGRWRVPGTGQLFEVQFHTQASLDAKEETHGAYERLRTLPDDDAEVSQLHAYQREVTAKIPIPPDALDIPDYR
jgi:hypothetical protein